MVRSFAHNSSLKYKKHRKDSLWDKHTVKGVLDRFETDFVRTRMAALEQFLARVSNDPLLSNAPCYKNFLTMKSFDFNSLKVHNREFLIPNLSFRTKKIDSLGKLAKTWRALSRECRPRFRPDGRMKIYSQRGWRIDSQKLSVSMSDSSMKWKIIKVII